MGGGMGSCFQVYKVSEVGYNYKIKFSRKWNYQGNFQGNFGQFLKFLNFNPF
jgi:hypothetical protein